MPPEQLVEALNWRYATREFDPSRTIPAAQWNALEQALVLAPSSIGLQPWKFLVVTDRVTKERLMRAAWHQAQVLDCSHFVVFAVRKNLGTDHVEMHMARMAEVRGVTLQSLEKFKRMTIGNLDKARAEGRLDAWQTHQVYIALGQFMTSAAVMGIDTCPLEGFEPEKFDETLGLAGSDYASVVACASGFRLVGDKYSKLKKVRFRVDDVVTRI